MNILLLDARFLRAFTVAIRMPNGALTSLAGNIDHHKVAAVDLILCQRVETVTQLAPTTNPT
jgi:hypothetical protein